MIRRDWLDHYCLRHKKPGVRFGVVDWFITIFYWFACFWVLCAIVAFLSSLVRIAIG